MKKLASIAAIAALALSAAACADDDDDAPLDDGIDNLDVPPGS